MPYPLQLRGQVSCEMQAGAWRSLAASVRFMRTAATRLPQQPPCQWDRSHSAQPLLAWQPTCLSSWRDVTGRRSRGQQGFATAAAAKPAVAPQEDRSPQLDALKDDAARRFTEAMEGIAALRVESGQDEAGTATLSLQEKLRRGINALQAGLFERDTEVRLLLLAALAGEHILFIGPPGTAKSVLGRRLASLCDGPFFERLLTRFSVPEELFGPLSMRELEADRYTRQTQGYLPTAAVAFVDEIFKANSAILNTLLTVLNERLFDNGTTRESIPLICLVGASNELPESEELDALYDRFLLRRQVQQVSIENLPGLLAASGREGDPGGGPGGFATSHSNGTGKAAADDAGFMLTQDELADMRRRAPLETIVPDEVTYLLTDLREYLQDKCEPPVYVSDRRLIKAQRLMQMAAYTSGRRLVSTQDCLLLQHMLWEKPDQCQKIADWLQARLAGDDGAPQLDTILEGLFQKALSVSKDKGQRIPTTLAKDLDNVKCTIQAKLAEAETGLDEKASTGQASAPVSSLWLSQVETAASESAAQPMMAKNIDAMRKLLFEVVTIQAATQGEVETLHLAQLIPDRWHKFLRKAPAPEVAPIGVRTRAKTLKKFAGSPPSP